jgi:acetylornithine deacetylase/succinyl-diaminopimelate desuccinylase-like protein
VGTTAPIDWEGALWDCVGHLQTLIRMDTVNPPGREIGLARYLDDVLRGAGISTRLFEPAPGRAVLVGRIPGTGRDRPLLLMAHMDVVGVEREKWRTNPFGGEILDGFVYGRGAIDDKGMLAVNLQTMLLVQQHLVGRSVRLSRDIVFLATSDEEAGGEHGIDWVVNNEPGLIDAEYALNEGGRIRVAEAGVLYAAVQCAEKTPHLVRVTARGPAGHAAIPLPGNSIGRLARALAAVMAHSEPVVLNDITRRFFGGLAALWADGEERAAMADLASSDPARVSSGARRLGARPQYDAVLRNGVSPTMLEAGVRTNVIPAEARALLNVRCLPGESIDALVARLAAQVHDPDVRFEIESRSDDAPPSPVDSPMFQSIADSIAALAPGVPTLPYLSTGATDSAPLRKVGVRAYGLLPFPLTQEDEERMHGHDERVPVSSLSFAVRLTYSIVERMTSGS